MTELERLIAEAIEEDQGELAECPVCYGMGVYLGAPRRVALLPLPLLRYQLQQTRERRPRMATHFLTEHRFRHLAEDDRTIRLEVVTGKDEELPEHFKVTLHFPKPSTTGGPYIYRFKNEAAAERFIRKIAAGWLAELYRPVDPDPLFRV